MVGGDADDPLPRSYSLKQMSEFLFLGLEVSGVVSIWLGTNWYALYDFQPVAFEADDLAGIVGQEADFPAGRHDAGV